MSTTGSKEADVETSATSPTDADLDRTFLGKISTDGIIAFGGSDDTFFFYPRAGFIEDESLDKKLPFNIDKDKLTKLERLAETSFHYEPEGDVYSMKVFARVNEGMYFPWWISHGCHKSTGT